jgi:hypothetical protein
MSSHPVHRHPLAASRPVHPRALLTCLAVGLGVAAAFISVFFAAMHDPAPHGLPVTVIGPPQTVAQVEVSLDRLAPGGFRFTPYPDSVAAGRAVAERDLYGALDLSGSGPAHIVLAGANGPGVTATITTAFTAAAQHLGRPVSLSDQAPLPAGDSRGSVVFYYVFGLALSSFLFSVAFHQNAAGASLAVRLTVPLLFAAAVGAMATTLAGTGFGALTGHPWQIAALSALLSYAVTTTTTALTRLLRGAGIAVAGLLFIITGNATSGGALNWHYLPGGWRWVSQMLPTGAGVTGLLNIQYFQAHHLSPALLTLGLWTAASLLLLTALPLIGLDAVHRSHASEAESPRPKALAPTGS